MAELLTDSSICLVNKNKKNDFNERLLFCDDGPFSARETLQLIP